MEREREREGGQAGERRCLRRRVLLARWSNNWSFLCRGTCFKVVPKTGLDDGNGGPGSSGSIGGIGSKNRAVGKSCSEAGNGRFFVFALKQFLREDRISSPDGNKIKAF